MKGKISEKCGKKRVSEIDKRQGNKKKKMKPRATTSVDKLKQTLANLDNASPTVSGNVLDSEKKGKKYGKLGTKTSGSTTFSYGRFRCANYPKCQKVFVRRAYMYRHYYNKHDGKVWPCPECGWLSNCSADLKKHRENKHSLMGKIVNLKKK